MDDSLIRRQDAIDRINKQREHLRPDVFPQDAIGDAAYRVCAEFIERLPSAEPCDNCIHDGEDWDSEACDGCVATDRANRVFVAIVVEYPKVSTYKEYEGKPYFSIKYIEDGQKYIGYGTYSPKVLSEYLRKYFMPSGARMVSEDD